jgi:L-glutamine-phosphate cytidylyltransferase
MKAIILAAGRGKRLYPYTESKPKCQLILNGRTLLDWQMGALRHCGISDICIVKGHGSETIPVNIRSYLNPEYDTTNMVASLFCASTEIYGECLVCYSDILYEPRVLQRLMNANAGDVQVVIDRNWLDYYQRRYSDPYAEAESLICADDQVTITDIGALPSSRDQIHGQFVGLIRLTPSGASIFLDKFRGWRSEFWKQPWMRGRSLKQAFMTDFLQALIDDGVRVCAVSIQNGWLEFDNVHDYENVRAWLQEGSLEPLFSFNWAAINGQRQ